MTAITLDIIGNPTGQPRPKATSIGKHARVYTPRRTSTGKTHPIVTWRGAIKEAALPCRPETPLTGPVSVDIELRFKRPKSHYGTGRNAGKLKDSAPDWHTNRPDVDNLTKAILDVLTECGYWRDDSQVCTGGIRKRYVKQGELAGATVTISQVDDSKAWHILTRRP